MNATRKTAVGAISMYASRASGFQSLFLRDSGCVGHGSSLARCGTKKKGGGCPPSADTRSYMPLALSTAAAAASRASFGDACPWNTFSQAFQVSLFSVSKSSTSGHGRAVRAAAFRAW